MRIFYCDTLYLCKTIIPMKNRTNNYYLIALIGILPILLNSCAKDTTTTVWTCGSSITVNHIAGAVAPVSKTVTYGTITNIPGEPTKCWITSNLGADHQASYVEDATEASAGWYWQFNRKQGYKNDGSAVTPYWKITNINENTDWLSTNDPCALELGSAWRLPAHTEWENIDISGNWTNWSGPWNSGIKLHAAGSLYVSNGSIDRRGFYGYYWSSVQYDSNYGWTLHFSNVYSDMLYDFKAYGFSIRCLKDN